MKRLIKWMFYSRLFQDIRVEYYHEAYQQGKFDREMELTVESNVKCFMKKSGLEDMFDMNSKLEIKGQ